MNIRNFHEKVYTFDFRYNVKMNFWKPPPPWRYALSNEYPLPSLPLGKKCKFGPVCKIHPYDSLSKLTRHPKYIFQMELPHQIWEKNMEVKKS